jgi:aspartyl protease family protein
MKLLLFVLALILGSMLALVLTHDQGTVFGMEQNKFAAVVFYSSWGIVAAAAFLPRRGQWGQALRNMVLWIAIIFLLVTGYMYRYELQDIAYRVTAGFVPGSPLQSVSADGREQITLLRVGHGQFNARGAVNGTPTAFVVDTGASVVVLTHQDAEAAGIRTSGLSYSVPVATANGRTTAARVNIDSLTIGSIERRDVMALVSREGALDTSLLGMNFLTSLFSFEVRGDRLILTD